MTKRSVKNEVLIRAYVVFFLLTAVAGAILLQGMRIHLVEGDHWRSVVDSEYLRTEAIVAERGNILAEDYRPMAVSLQFFDITMDLKAPCLQRNFHKKLDSLAYKLAMHVNRQYTPGMMKMELLKQHKAGNRSWPLVRRAPYTVMRKIESDPFLSQNWIRRALVPTPVNQREHPFRPLASRTLGQLDAEDGKGAVGLEDHFERELAGDAGSRLVHRVSGGVTLPVNSLHDIEPKPGRDIVTTIDIDLQDIVHDCLHNAVRKHQAEWGTAVLMEVKTGAIKAIANVGKRRDGRYDEIYNYAVGNSGEPGSTFKLASIMALLEDGLIDINDSIDIEQGKTTYFDEEMTDASYHEIDTTTIREAFIISSNVGISKLVDSFYNKDEESAKKFIRRLEQFKLNEPLGIGIKGEGMPFIKEPFNEKQDWSGTTLPWMSIGYEVRLTPLQLLTFYNAVANNGMMMNPYLVSEVRMMDEVEERFYPSVRRSRIASRRSIITAQELLRAVVESGTAKDLNSSVYPFSGKTGTARINYGGKSRTWKKEYQSSFVGYFPSDRPKYSCIIVINKPQAYGYYGSEVAAPVFREIADKCVALKLALSDESMAIADTGTLHGEQLPRFQAGFKDDVATLLALTGSPYLDESDGDWVVTVGTGDTVKLGTRRMKAQKVPSVEGMSIKDALYILENMGLQVHYRGVGRITKQSLPPGTDANGQHIYLQLE